MGRQKPETDVPYDLFELDPLQLDKHFLEQPKLVIKYGIQLADVKDSADRAKAQLELTRAEAEAEITANPEPYGIVKVTVSAVNSAVARHEDVLSAQERFQSCRHKVDVLTALMNALEHRKRALEGLIQLHGQQYFAAPRASQENRESMEEQTKRAVRSRRVRENQDDD